MGVIDDLAQDLRDYPDNNVRLSIVNFQEPGEVINAGEVCTFRIMVSNDGYLDMTKVSLHLNAASGITQLSQTDILGNPINFANNLTTAFMNIPAGSSATTRTFFMKALVATDRRRLIEAHIAEWDAGLSSLLRVQAGHDTGAQVEYSRDIRQQ